MNNLKKNKLQRRAKRLYALMVCLPLQSHDPSQRSNSMLTIAGGIVITFTREILTLITGTGA